MCGIVGYVGNRPAAGILMEGLKRVEYRGYDSAGIALLQRRRIKITKRAGRVQALEPLVADAPGATTGIGHTRWATHGRPTDTNAHPHPDASGRIAVVHNGVLENFDALTRKCVELGVELRSETDTELLAHLIGHHYEALDRPGDPSALVEAVQQTLQQVEGTYGLVVLASDCPGHLVAARNGSPLIVGVGEGEMLVASDVAAIAAHTRDVFYLDDRELVHLSTDGYTTRHMERGDIVKPIETIPQEMEELERGGYRDFMLKEIHEQPTVMERAALGRLVPEMGTVKLGGMSWTREESVAIERVQVVACGTSYYASLAASYVFEDLARLPCRVDVASEFRYRNPVIDPRTLYLAVSQSGETADTLAALREIQIRGGKVYGVCNVVGSTLARESDGGVYVHAGLEVAVASTKCFTAQLLALEMVAILLGRMRHLSPEQGRKLIHGIRELPDQMHRVLQLEDRIHELARSVADTSHFLFLGRGAHYAVALEGALKMKELTYIPSEGNSAGEMKHGPNALIDDGVPVIMVALRDDLYEKVLANIQEVRARGGRVIALATEGDTEIGRHADEVLEIPETLPQLSPLLTAVPVQLLAYYVALTLGRDIDKPRNLAKCVTVE